VICGKLDKTYQIYAFLGSAEEIDRKNTVQNRGIKRTVFVTLVKTV
jgi:hypothetical protein